MFGRKKKIVPAPVPVDGLHVKELHSHYRHTETRVFELDEDEFIKQVLKLDGGHIEEITRHPFDPIRIKWVKYN